MTNRERVNAILHYQPADRVPVVAFGYWNETVNKWADEGYITREDADNYCRYGDNGPGDRSIMAKLGFDFNWNCCVGSAVMLYPAFETIVLEERPDGSRIIRNSEGLICNVKPGVNSIPGEIGTFMTGREVWEQEYLPRLQMNDNRPSIAYAKTLPAPEDRDYPIALHLGSLIGHMRNMLGVENLSYLYADDEELYAEIVDTLCGLCYECAKKMLESGETGRVCKIDSPL